MQYLRELRKHVRLDSFGACAHNNDTCPKAGRHKCDKIVRAGAYKFVFAFENTEESHYVTEKVYTGLRSGAVPVYRATCGERWHCSQSCTLLQPTNEGSRRACFWQEARPRCSSTCQGRKASCWRRASRAPLRSGRTCISWCMTTTRTLCTNSGTLARFRAAKRWRSVRGNAVCANGSPQGTNDTKVKAGRVPQNSN